MLCNDFNDILKLLVEEKGWKTLLVENHKLFAKKLIAIDEFFIKIEILDENIINFRNSMKINVDEIDHYSLFSFINSINKYCFYGCYTIDDIDGYIVFNYNLYLKEFKIQRIENNIEFIRSIFYEMESLSKKMSLGIHKILYSNYKIDQINKFVLVDTIGNA